MIRKFLFILCLAPLVGCGSEDSTATENVLWRVAYDQKSKQAYLIETSVQLPVSNPENPRSQLQPALYCASCQKWYPAPPLEQLNRTPGAGKCPKDSGPLTVDGPLPEQKLNFRSEASE